MLTATVMDGKSISQNILDTLQTQISDYEINPSLHVIFVGDDEASKSYIRMKEKKAESIGMNAEIHSFPESTNGPELIKHIETLNNKPSVDGIIVQLPLPGGLNEFKLLETVSPEKDVDGLHPLNFGKLLGSGIPHFYPPTPKGILTLLDEYEVEYTSQTAVLVGTGRLVGRPLSQMFLNKQATVFCLNESTPDLHRFTQQADILVAAAGVPELITQDHVSENTIVVDVGIHKEDDTLVGDVKYDEVSDKARAITPVPGGVGPLTVATLLQNTVKSAKRKKLNR